MKKIIILFILSTSAYSKDVCNFVKWPYKNTKEDVQKISREVNINYMHSYFMYEITTGKDQQLAKNLFEELVLNEERKDFVNFTKLLAHSSDLQGDKFNKLKKDKVCKVYMKVLTNNKK